MSTQTPQSVSQSVDLKQQSLARIQYLRKSLDDAIIEQRTSNHQLVYLRDESNRMTSNVRVTSNDCVNAIVALNKCLKAEMAFYNSLP